jgi:hypothetical protein
VKVSVCSKRASVCVCVRAIQTEQVCVCVRARRSGESESEYKSARESEIE